MRISLWGGPGSGKSTCAAYLFSKLKQKKYKVEFCIEAIKNWAYIGRKTKSFDQLFIFGQQLHSEDLIFQSGLHSVTDSPLLMQTVYAIKYNFPAYKELIDISLKYEEVNPSINIFLNRGKIPYETIGRYENYEQALEMDNKIKEMLNHYLKYEIFDTNDFDQILKYVEQSLLTDSNMVKSWNENH